MNLIKSALHNLSKSEAIKDNAYTHGLLVGIVSAIMHERNLTYQETVHVVKDLLPTDYDIDRITPAWRGDFS